MVTDPEINDLPPDSWPLHLAMAAVEFGLLSFAIWEATEQTWPSQKEDGDYEPDEPEED
jgi:hypothetical protein